jgi:hypothetical protein
MGIPKSRPGECPNDQEVAMTMNMLSPMQKQMSVARTKLLFFMTASAIALVSATPAGALTITQLSNKDVGDPPFPATACVDVQNFATANGSLSAHFLVTISSTNNGFTRMADSSVSAPTRQQRLQRF